MRPRSTSAMATPPRRRRCRVAIVGAGASGLVAAKTLLPQLTNTNGRSHDGHSMEPLLILEARDRVGGRIHTSSLPNHDGLPVDMGAAWVHGTGVPYGHRGKGCEDDLNPMVKLLQQRTDLDENDKRKDPLGAGLVYTSPKGNLDTRPRDVLHSGPGTSSATDDTQHLVELHVAGKKIDQSSSQISKALDMYEEILAAASKVGASAYDCGDGMATATISIGKTIDVIRSDAPSRYGLGYKVGGDSSSSNDQRLVETLLGYYLHTLQVWHPHDLANVQLSEFIVEEEKDDDGSTGIGGDEGDFPGPHCNVKGGMSAILGPLQSNGVEECICFNQEVTVMEQFWAKDGTESSTTIILSCKSGLLVEADYCIVTIPISCLKDSVSKSNGLFCPRLSEEKEEAIKMLQMGSYKKVFLIFDDVFWAKGPSFFGLARKEVQEPELFGVSSIGLGNYLNVDNSFARDAGVPILEVTLAGGAAQWANGRSLEEIRTSVLAFMGDCMFVEDGSSFSARCIDSHITRWEEDRFSKGAYAGFKLGTLERHAANLAEPEWNGRLLFAGDAIISEYEGSVHGALLSGKEAAEKIGKRLST